MRFLRRLRGGPARVVELAPPLDDPPFRYRELNDWRGRGVVNDVYVRLHGRHVWHRVRHYRDAPPGYAERGRTLTFACYLGSQEHAPDRRGRLVPLAVRTDQPGPGERCKDCRRTDEERGHDDLPA